jgi:hypothetical protein
MRGKRQLRFRRSNDQATKGDRRSADRPVRASSGARNSGCLLPAIGCPPAANACTGTTLQDVAAAAAPGANTRRPARCTPGHRVRMRREVPRIVTENPGGTEAVGLQNLDEAEDGLVEPCWSRSEMLVSCGFRTESRVLPASAGAAGGIGCIRSSSRHGQPPITAALRS